MAETRLTIRSSLLKKYTSWKTCHIIINFKINITSPQSSFRIKVPLFVLLWREQLCTGLTRPPRPRRCTRLAGAGAVEACSRSGTNNPSGDEAATHVCTSRPPTAPSTQSTLQTACTTRERRWSNLGNAFDQGATNV